MLLYRSSPFCASFVDYAISCCPPRRFSRTLALPQLFAHARTAADKLVEPEIRHIKLEGATLRTPEDVAGWIDRTNQDLLRQVKQGPVVIG